MCDVVLWSCKSGVQSLRHIADLLYGILGPQCTGFALFSFHSVLDVKV